MIDRLRRPFLVLATLGLAFALASCGSDASSSAPDSSGEDLYRTNCATCHGTDGGGGLGKSLKGVSERLTVEEHRAIIVNGKGQMPAWEGNLTSEEIDAVVDYERTVLDQ